jgi:hypothetical protein
MALLSILQGFQKVLDEAKVHPRSNIEPTDIGITVSIEKQPSFGCLATVLAPSAICLSDVKFFMPRQYYTYTDNPVVMYLSVAGERNAEATVKFLAKHLDLDIRVLEGEALANLPAFVYRLDSGKVEVRIPPQPDGCDVQVMSMMSFAGRPFRGFPLPYCVRVCTARLFVTRLNVKTFALYVTPSTTIGRVAEMIQETEGIPVERQVLISTGRKLTSSSFFGFRDESGRQLRFDELTPEQTDAVTQAREMHSRTLGELGIGGEATIYLVLRRLRDDDGDIREDEVAHV